MVRPSIPYGRLPHEARKALVDAGELRTIEEWNMTPGKPVVVDPDGFDRSDPDLYVRLFTEEEFDRGALYSTVFPVPENWTKDID